MTQASPEGNFSSREDTLLKNTSVQTAGRFADDPNFIGPLDANDFARGFLLRRAHDLAEIGALQLSAYEGERARFVAATRQDVSEGRLRLNGEYKDMTVEQQVQYFVMDAINQSVTSRHEVEAELAVEKEAQNLGARDLESGLRLEVNKLKESLRLLSNGIFEVRGMLIERGASDEFMRTFYHATKLMTKPDQEAYELEMQLDTKHETPPLVDTGEVRLLERFKHVLSPSFGRRALRSIGIRSPKSGEVHIIRDTEKTL